MALDGGLEHQFTFSPAISFFVNCETQVEVDFLWEKLSEGGQKQMCGWVQDKYGISWQIIPTILGILMSDPDPIKAKRVIDAMLQMTKLDISLLEKAYRGE
jgi:predicted 3-demethylubiquinone-9 3-methyltransferase (glyoxalase superfamily)